MPDRGRVCVDDFLNISEPVLLDLPVTSSSVPALWHPAMFSFLFLFFFSLVVVFLALPSKMIKTSLAR